MILRGLAATFLVAYVACVSVALGTMAMILIAHLTTATWFRDFRPRAWSVVRTLPALAAIGVVLLIAMPVLYPWVGTDVSAHRYLSAPFFVVRFVIYWAIWLYIARSIRIAQLLEARGELQRATHRFRVTACAGLIALGLSMTFAAFDWMMSLTPDWSSTIYGVYWWAGGLVGSLALLAILSQRQSAGWPDVAVDDVHSLAKLLVTFILFWLYIGFSQYIVIWSAGLPREASWYVARMRGGWGVLAAGLLFGHFVLPFLLLLLRGVKRSPGLVAIVGTALLCLHVLDAFWVVMPGAMSVR